MGNFYQKSHKSWLITIKLQIFETQSISINDFFYSIFYKHREIHILIPEYSLWFLFSFALELTWDFPEMKFWYF